MNFSVRIIFDRLHRASDKVEGIVEVEYYSKGLRRRYRTGVRVLPSQWRDGMVVNRLDAVELNEKIHQKYKWVTQLAADGAPMVSKFGKENEAGFCKWLEERVDSRTDITESTRRQHMVMARAVRASGCMIHFSDITVANLQRFDDHVRRNATVQASVYSYHKRLKIYIQIAHRLGLIKDNPYDDFKVSRGTGGHREYLTEAERSAIENLQLHGTTAIVRDMFILSCYTGLAYVDLVKISRDNIVIGDNGTIYLEDKRLKTGARYRLKLLPPALKILERYDWNMNRACNQVCNHELKIIAAYAGVKKRVSMHVGRHTFATWALSRGVSIEVVSKMLAHADISTTQIYAKILQESVDKGFDMLM